MNIEEAIKQLKKHKAEIDKEYISARYSKAIETLLTAYEKEKEKNNKLMEELDLTTVYISGVYDGEKKWKDKIKAKIEELIKEGNYRTADNPNGRVHFQKEITDYQIEVLQSLLEKE